MEKRQQRLLLSLPPSPPLDNESGIIEYQYAIGTSPGGTDVVGWTSLADKTQIEVTGLSLSVGKTYYVNVKAKNKAGLWSEIGTSDGITVAETPVIMEEKVITPLR